MSRLAIGFGALVAACSSSSSDSAGGAEGPPGTFSEIYPAIFPETTKGQCNFCHGLPANEKSNGKLSVGKDKATAYKALVGPMSSSLHCSGKAYVVPGDPGASLLYGKVTSAPCGDHMPLGGSSLTSEQVDKIRTWIAAGAKDD